MLSEANFLKTEKVEFMTLFNDCFGDLPVLEQEKILIALRAVTIKINENLKTDEKLKMPTKLKEKI